MPELPEVTTIAEDVASLAVGRKVLRAAVFRPDVTNVEPEEFSRKLAGRTLRATGRRGKDAKAQRDAIAASIILQSYLDSRRDGALPPLPPIE